MTNDDAFGFQWCTSFDELPTEIILHIFDYLTCNDVIYTFLSLNARFRALLLYHECYSNHYQLPIEDWAFWQNVLPDIARRIRVLSISTSDLSLSLDEFPHLTTVIVSSPYGLSDRSLQALFASKSFPHLRILKIRSENYLRPRSSLLRDNSEHYFFTNIFNGRNRLEVFEYLSPITLFSRKTMSNFETNSSLSSLTLRLNEFRDIFVVLRYTPNLIDLNVTTVLCSIHQTHDKRINEKEFRLQKLCLTLLSKRSLPSTDPSDFLHLISDVKLFSSSLTSLAMNFVDLNIESTDEFPFNGLKLQHQLLKSMTALERFHLYSKTRQQSIDIQSVLSTFNDQFWLDRHWSLGMHGKYLYTLPFHFHELHGFTDFDDIRSNNDTILTHPNIWRHVKLIELTPTTKFDVRLIKQLKIKLPRLTTIRFLSSGLYSYSQVMEHPHVTEEEMLTNVITVHSIGGSIENIQEWLVYALPNVQHLILSYTGLPSSSSRLASILGKRIRRLDVHEHFTAEQIITIEEICFGNLEEVRLTLFHIDGKFQWYVNVLRNILAKYERLKLLWICLVDENSRPSFGSSEVELTKIIEYVQTNGLTKNYRIERHRESALFFRDRFS